VTILSDVGAQFGGTCGSSLWAGSTALVAWLGEQPQHSQYSYLFAGRAVLELGAGLGLVGLALDKMGAARVCPAPRPGPKPTHH
jgi:predicted nicotinamide N-methyase